MYSAPKAKKSRVAATGAQTCTEPAAVDMALVNDDAVWRFNALFGQLLANLSWCVATG